MDKTLLKGCLILIVEDYKDTRDAIRLFLDLCGARVLTAATGRDGLDLVSRYHPKVIVSDLSMPQIDGYDLLGHVRELTPEDAAPVIALTAHSDAEERQKALKAGFARFLTKPVDPEQLVHEICNVLEPDLVFLTKTAKSQFVSKNSDLRPAPRRPYRGLPPRD